MNLRYVFVATTLTTLTACAGLAPPAADKLAAMPMVTYPDKPPAGDFIYKLPAGQPIDLNIRADGSLLAANLEQKISASLKHDLYLHKDWASEDAQQWQRADRLVGVNLRVTLPSYQNPGPGEMHMTLERKTP